MGETAMRLGRVRLRSLRGANRWSVGWVTGDWMWLGADSDLRIVLSPILGGWDVLECRVIT
jgi:hypothetical protein